MLLEEGDQALWSSTCPFHPSAPAWFPWYLVLVHLSVVGLFEYVGKKG